VDSNIHLRSFGDLPKFRAYYSFNHVEIMESNPQPSLPFSEAGT